MDFAVDVVIVNSVDKVCHYFTVFGRASLSNCRNLYHSNFWQQDVLWEAVGSAATACDRLAFVCGLRRLTFWHYLPSTRS